MSNFAIRVENVHKTFKLPHDKAASIKGSLINIVRRERSYDVQAALEDISFEVKKGEFFGIVGKNGGGKSTLLKIISRIYTPSSGVVHVDGKLTPFIELGVGFNPELTGRENVFLNGALLGFNRSEMLAMYDEIVAFAELEPFMEQKLKNYSSGMQVRLAFSIAIRAKSDILVMDEVLAVGDAAFQKKCLEVFRDLKKQKKTIILVTHDMANVERFCDRALVINKGKSLGVHTAQEASSIYAKLNVDEQQLIANDEKSKGDIKERWGDHEVLVDDIKLSRDGNRHAKTFNTGEPLDISFELKYKDPDNPLPVVMGLAFYDEDGNIVAGPNTQDNPIKPGANKVKIHIPVLPFRPGSYALTTVIYDADSIQVHDYLDKWTHFSVIADHAVSGMFEIDNVSWSS